MSPVTERPAKPSSLADHLTALRAAKGMTLRQVEEATGREVSNAYLSQIENGKIAKPSPNILHSLARAYGTRYEDLMERAGYLIAEVKRGSGRRQAKVATFAIDDLTPEEEDQLLKYAAFIRSQRKRT